MTHPSKRKIKVKKQERDNDRRFAKKPQIIDDWGDVDDSGLDDEIDLLSEKEDKYNGCFKKLQKELLKLQRL
ncbi:146_t:CDS:2 [Funneliformis geosporum]|uniref:146_t:CDS:1 n=1 Tax=Funneliformis geosporum TaxID=1117311 RepID=A0A9W4WWG1_9GLOM|nr:146_t:CDS:2 [Funneliformis geosporum]